MKKLLKLIVFFFACIGFLTVIVIFGLMSLVESGVSSIHTSSPVPDRVILELDLTKPVVEYVDQDSISGIFNQHKLTVMKVIESLRLAADDDRVVGVIAKIDSVPMGLATRQQIYSAVADFKRSGKFTAIYAETFGQMGQSSGAYYLATAFDKIYLQPCGDLNLTGIIYQSPFIKGTLEKLHIEPRLESKEEYKNMKNLFTETGYTEFHKEALEKVMHSQFDQIVTAIATARNLDVTQVRHLVNRAPLSAIQATEAGLVDELLYRDQIYNLLNEKYDDADFMEITDYVTQSDSAFDSGEKVAIIYGLGEIHAGSSEPSPFGDNQSIGSDTICEALRDVMDDDDVGAIILRINSPGGSYVASDTIWRQIGQARAAGKFVVASMSDVAASGGYYLAMACDKIVAEPGTITGSIGVVGGKFLTREFWSQWLGVTFDSVQIGENANIWSAVDDYSDSQHKKVIENISRAYDDFVTKAAQGRNMSKAAMLKVAKGRIWTGADAKDLGLVDSLGGLVTAIDIVRKELGVSPDGNINLQVYPKPKTFFESLIGMTSGGASVARNNAAIKTLIEQAKPLSDIADRVKRSDSGILMAPDIDVKW